MCPPRPIVSIYTTHCWISFIQLFYKFHTCEVYHFWVALYVVDETLETIIFQTTLFHSFVGYNSATFALFLGAEIILSALGTLIDLTRQVATLKIIKLWALVLTNLCYAWHVYGVIKADSAFPLQDSTKSSQITTGFPFVYPWHDLAISRISSSVRILFHKANPLICISPLSAHFSISLRFGCPLKSCTRLHASQVPDSD